jgi:hypothetical protein
MQKRWYDKRSTTRLVRDALADEVGKALVKQQVAAK